MAIVREYINDAIFAEVTGSLQGVSRDPKDDMVFECAVKARAEVIVSGDNDLLVVKEHAGVRVLMAPVS